MPASPKALLEMRGLRAKRSFGQNFLTDPSIAQRIAELCTTPTGGTVVELGAGLGALTLPLAARAARVIAVERDRDLVPALGVILSDAGLQGVVEVLEADAKAIDIPGLLEGGPRPHVLAGNLPYQLTGTLLRSAIVARGFVARAVFLVQLEVAERLTARPGTAAWGALSVFAQAAFDVRKELVVKRGAFFPQPRVDSAVVVLGSEREPRAEETPLFRDLVSRAFQKRRKTLRNAWRGAMRLDDATLESAARDAGVDLSLRGEVLDIVAFTRMAEALEARCA